jgi:hypothetical protein
MHTSWGSFTIFSQILLWCLIITYRFFHLVERVHLVSISSVCFFLKINLFLLSALCHHEKCGGFDLFVGTSLLFFGVGHLVSWFVLNHFQWDNLLSMCILFILHAPWFFPSSLGELCGQSYVDLISDHSYVDLICCQSCVDLLIWYNLD